MTNIAATFDGVLAKLKTAGEKVKQALITAMQTVDTKIEPDIQKIQPALDQVADAAVPGSSTIVNDAIAWFEKCAAIIDAGGEAAEQNFTNAGLDVTAIQTVKAAIPTLKAASTTK